MPGHRIASLSALALYVLSAVSLLAGRDSAALVALLIGIGLSVASEIMSGRRVQASPDLADDQAAELRADRDSLGEVAAVKRLRTEYPELSLVNATRIVREL